MYRDQLLVLSDKSVVHPNVEYKIRDAEGHAEEGGSEGKRKQPMRLGRRVRDAGTHRGQLPSVDPQRQHGLRQIHHAHLANAPHGVLAGAPLRQVAPRRCRRGGRIPRVRGLVLQQGLPSRRGAVVQLLPRAVPSKDLVQHLPERSDLQTRHQRAYEATMRTATMERRPMPLHRDGHQHCGGNEASQQKQWTKPSPIRVSEPTED
mmetsp:Transcript_122136/g.390640  ORF Transcript_122136/g.390640 Transcript_122136/m.390640 type:complete len:205 (-) Transcript_122136:157-771(-)